VLLDRHAKLARRVRDRVVVRLIAEHVPEHLHRAERPVRDAPLQLLEALWQVARLQKAEADEAIRPALDHGLHVIVVQIHVLQRVREQVAAAHAHAQAHALDADAVGAPQQPLSARDTVAVRGV